MISRNLQIVIVTSRTSITNFFFTTYLFLKQVLSPLQGNCKDSQEHKNTCEQNHYQK